MEKELVSLFFVSYAYGILTAAKTLLGLLDLALSAAEAKYFKKIGPQIAHHYLRHDIYTAPGGCPEGKAERESGRGSGERS